MSREGRWPVHGQGGVSWEGRWPVHGQGGVSLEDATVWMGWREARGVREKVIEYSMTSVL